MNRPLRIAILLLLTVLLMFPAGAVAYGDTVLIGDVDGDGEITAQDANHITRYLAQFETLDAAQRTRADFDGDGAITAYDATLVLSAVVAPEEQPGIKWSFSAIVTSDLKGEAWGSVSEDKTGYCSALNLVTFVREQRERDPGALLIDAGGSLFGSVISDEYTTYTSKRVGPMTRIFQSLSYDAILLGTEAVTHQSQMIRNDMDSLTANGTQVLGANLSKVYPLDTDPEVAPWNDILSGCVIEVEQPDERVLRVGLIGVVEPDLADPQDEVYLSDPVKAFETARSAMKGKCDVCLLLYYGNAENDESQSDVYSLRKLLRRITDVDMALVSHGAGSGVRTALDGRGREVPVISLADGVEFATKLSVACRDSGTLVYKTETVDLRAYPPDETLQAQIMPYVNAMSELMDARIGTVTKRIEPFEPDTLGSTDGMELLHEMQIWCAQQWIDSSDMDLPPTVLSIAYPYLGTTGWNAGAVRYRDVCALRAETPRYTLMLVRGAELKAWLSAYAERITSEKIVYSLYGLSYLLNTINPETPLGFLEYSSGMSVEEDAVFTLILADDPNEDLILLPYLDESWMTFEDRVITEFSMPSPQLTETSEIYRTVDPLVAYLESVETFKLKHEYSWIVI